MKNSTRFISSAAALVLVLAPVAAFAHEDGISQAPTPTRAVGQAHATSTTGDQDTAARLADAKERATREIDRRISELNELATRINEIVRLTEAQKSSFATSISGQITALQALKVEIAAKTEAAGLRASIKSLTDSYRIYAFTFPQISIIAAASRALGTAEKFEDIRVKLEERIAASKSAGDDVAALEATLISMGTKIMSAKQKAQDALDAVNMLRPSNGDQKAYKANHNELKEAHVKVRSAQQDIVDARKLAGDIVRTLRALAKGRMATTTPTR